jgi:formylglycine-generating enzyme required for sulfatase activity/predicted secreted protein
MFCGGGGDSTPPAPPQTAPTIATQPVAQTVISPATAVFSAAASGNPTPTYQWQVSTNSGGTWANVSSGSGGTSATYTTAATSLSNDGWLFRVVASNGVGSPATSSSVSLTVHSAPSISAQPSDKTVVAPDPATFSVTATGNPALSYQWQVSTDGGSSWTAVATGTGGTSASYTTAATSSSNQGWQYRVVITNGIGSAATSASATLTINSAPLISLQPGDKSVTAPNTATFTAAATGTPAPGFQWQVSIDSGSTWTNVATGSGGTSASYTTAATSSADDGSLFRAVADNGVGVPAISGSAKLTVYFPPTFTTDLSATQTVTAGANATFTVVAASNPAPTYTWERSNDGGTTWSAIGSVTTATYTFTPNIADTTARFRAKASDGTNTATSTVSTLTVTPVTLTLALPDVTNLPNTVPLVLEPIPAGTFTMGSPAPGPNYSLGDYPKGEPRHDVTIAKPFYMAKFQCTQAQWMAIMGGSNPAGYIAANNPIETVSYEDIATPTTGFLDKLNAATASIRPPGMSFRLPTEAEWEYACRAGSTTNFFYGADDQSAPVNLDLYAWFSGSAFPGGSPAPQPVGGKLPNAWGLYDMAGNVFELCEDDWHPNYVGAPTDGSAWVDSPRGASHAARGGSFPITAHWCQSHERGETVNSNHDTDDGFRLVLAVTAP